MSEAGRWGIERSPLEAYSRVSNAERFRRQSNGVTA